MEPSDARALAIHGRLCDLPNTEESKRIIELHNLRARQHNRAGFAFFVSLVLLLSFCYGGMVVADSLVSQYWQGATLISGLALGYVVMVVLLFRWHRRQQERAQEEFDKLLRQPRYQEALQSLEDIYNECSMW